VLNLPTFTLAICLIVYSMAHTQTAVQKVTIGDRLVRSVQGYRRLNRLYFPSPAEVKFVRVMRGRTLSIPFIKSKRTGFCLTFIWRGRILKGELIEREVQVGQRHYCIDFATRNASYKKGIDITSDYHTDVLADQERDEYLKARGWEVLYVPARRVFREPRKVYVDVLKFLKK
jgi:very-short-patch-repair endonuclease